MTPIKQGKYEFKKESLIDVRKKMGISQAKMAEVLGVPANTLSRWEIGTTVPDAKNLAGFYSLAKEHGITPAFFGLREGITPFKYNSLIVWDFQTTGTQAYWVKQAHDSIVAETGKRFTGMIPEYKVFAHPSQGQQRISCKALSGLSGREEMKYLMTLLIILRVIADNVQMEWS